eukprot:3601785-Amphidinium_carterae.1
MQRALRKDLCKRFGSHSMEHSGDSNGATMARVVVWLSTKSRELVTFAFVRQLSMLGNYSTGIGVAKPKVVERYGPACWRKPLQNTLEAMIESAEATPRSR